jgi:hypothetical protein
VRRPERGTTQLAVRDEVLSLRSDELDRLLEALVGLDLRDAGAVAEQIRALRLAGGVIRLTPTEAELAALELALAGEARPLGPALLRLASICADEQLADGQPA